MLHLERKERESSGAEVALAATDELWTAREAAVVVEDDDPTRTWPAEADGALRLRAVGRRRDEADDEDEDESDLELDEDEDDELDEDEEFYDEDLDDEEDEDDSGDDDLLDGDEDDEE